MFTVIRLTIVSAEVIPRRGINCNHFGIKCKEMMADIY